MSNFNFLVFFIMFFFSFEDIKPDVFCDNPIAPDKFYAFLNRLNRTIDGHEIKLELDQIEPCDSTGTVSDSSK